MMLNCWFNIWLQFGKANDAGDDNDSELTMKMMKFIMFAAVNDDDDNDDDGVGKWHLNLEASLVKLYLINMFKYS